ncbi:MAG: TlpA family protein disulfide reductase [Calditrichae bacterium]|nr:TlpA family protein disulfide reductase [Calditrichia bacterium]
MKRLTILFIIFILPVTWLTAQEKSFKVTAFVHKPPKNLVILFKKIQLTENTTVVLDTIEHTNGKFSQAFNYEPGIYQVDFQGVTKANFAVEYGQVIAISVDLRPSKSNPVVDLMGSYDAEYVFQYDNFRKKKFAELVQPVREKIKRFQESSQKDSVAYYTQTEDQKMTEYSDALAEFAKSYFGHSIALFYAAIRLDPDRDFAFMEETSEWFNQNRPELSLTKELNDKVQRAKNIRLGSIAPVIEMPDADGKVIKLSDFKGSYVLVDFWASWCLPCRRENLNYATLNKKYRDQFKFFSISIDTSKNQWQQAEKKDGISWASVSDLQGWSGNVVKIYDVSTIPANFLIDPHGKIISKNIRGAALNKKLSEIFD